MNIAAIIKNNNLESYFYEGQYGVEKEGLRTTFEEKLALSDHPKSLGSRLHHPYLHTDFSESQVEIVTPALSSIEKVFNWLEALHDVLHSALDEKEYLWPYSMPNRLPEESEIPIIRYADSKAIQYREELAARYGRKLQTISGIHLNFSFNENFISKSFEYQRDYKHIKDFQNDLYMKLVANYLENEWLLIYLFGASPYADESFYDSKSAQNLKIPDDYIRSIRNSVFGYHNDEKVKVSYDSLEDYISDIEYFVQNDYLSEDREFYGNARLRGKGSQFKEMLNGGIDYVEFRSIDLNPLSRLGLTKDQLEFYHLFFMYMVWMDRKASNQEVEEGQKRNLITAHENPFDESQFKKEGLALLESMDRMVSSLNLESKYNDLIEKYQEQLKKPKESLSAKIALKIENDSYLDLGRKLGKEYKNYSISAPYILNGFDDMELSTQLLIRNALRLGVKTEVLDRSDQFLRLTYKNQTEYIRNGNMTSKDTTISHFIMENKTVTKKILADDGFAVPLGDEYQSIDQALASYGKYQNQAIVIKPKSTNYGIGISVFKKSVSKKNYEEAVRIAFEKDDSVLIEEFVEGTEYRFFVLNDQVEAILLRKPANVIGDGKSTIQELIDEKNKNPLRGEKHRKPMGLLQKGEIEKLMLKEQGYDFNSIAPKDEVIYLRENSNISTGGDSIDFTDKMHESYHKIAIGIAQSLEVKVTGIDLIIPDYSKETSEEEPGYSCIEANFNPAMSMHTFVSEGKGRSLTPKILTMLFDGLSTD